MPTATITIVFDAASDRSRIADARIRAVLTSWRRAIVGQYLAEQHGVAIVPGAYFSAYGGEWVRFSYATPPERTQGAAERLLAALKSLQR